ncbi:MAG: hypothetical protein HKN91_00480 [Acidimicrobiia bacterium]|nr:hypothetical protein [Acidimicrobiia bacterium]
MITSQGRRGNRIGSLLVTAVAILLAYMAVFAPETGAYSEPDHPSACGDKIEFKFQGT